MPERKYGEWTRGNAGQVGRCVTVYRETPIGTIGTVVWEPHPDEAGTFGHDDDCGCASCELMAETRRETASAPTPNQEVDDAG